jgi:hypothetical protein
MGVVDVVMWRESRQAAETIKGYQSLNPKRDGTESTDLETTNQSANAGVWIKVQRNEGSSTSTAAVVVSGAAVDVEGVSGEPEGSRRLSWTIRGSIGVLGLGLPIGGRIHVENVKGVLGHWHLERFREEEKTKIERMRCTGVENLLNKDDGYPARMAINRKLEEGEDF